MRVCVATVAEGWYQEYIAPYLYCLCRAYPEYDVLIFARDKLTEETLAALDLLSCRYNFQIVTWEFEGYPNEPHMAAALRWVLFTRGRIERYFIEYDYIYINDIDILIMPESPSLAWQHIEHMRTLRLPYSNVVRDYDPPCLTGCHFVSADYVKKIAPITNSYNHCLRREGMSIVDKAKIPDERLLYQIVRDAEIGLPPRHESEEVSEAEMFNPANYQQIWFRPHHGIHVGIGRDPQRFEHLYQTDYYKDYFGQLLIEYDQIEKLIGNGRARALLGAAIEGHLK